MHDCFTGPRLPLVSCFVLTYPCVSELGRREGSTVALIEALFDRSLLTGPLLPNSSALKMGCPDV